MKEALSYILLGAYGGYVAEWDDAVSINEISIQLLGSSTFSQYVGAIKEHLFEDYEGHLFEPRLLGEFETIDKTVEHIWAAYNAQFDQPE